MNILKTELDPEFWDFAIKILESKEWVQGSMYIKRGPFFIGCCMLGAMQLVPGYVVIHNRYQYAQFNDKPGRTKDQVIRFMRCNGSVRLDLDGNPIGERSEYILNG